MSVVRSRTALLVLVVLATTPVPAAARQPASSLDHVESALAAGRLTEARQTLEQWRRQHPAGLAGVSSEEHARALLLEGRLSGEASAAEEAYLGVVLAYPSSAAAPEALLRLGQALVANAEYARAIGYLERLGTDYPGARQRTTGLIWLARAYRLGGQRAAACANARRAYDAADGEADRHELAGLERAAACSDGEASPATTPASSPATRFAVQVGAFRERARAENLARMMREAGIDARVVAIDDSNLVRVRIGRFESARAAAVTAGNLAARGYSAIVVNDAHRERH
jgi:tetratricopeptide (TPR) repeat protein